MSNFRLDTSLLHKGAFILNYLVKCVKFAGPSRRARTALLHLLFDYVTRYKPSS